MVLTTALWGGSFVAGKIALREFPPMTLLFFRLLLATLVIIPILYLREDSRFPEKQDIPLLFGLGLMGVSLFFVFQFFALIYTSASNASIINALNPLISSILAQYLADESLSREKTLLLFIAFFGVLLTITNGDISAIINMNLDKGTLIMLLATLCFSIYSVYSRKATRKYSPLFVTAYLLLFGLIQVTPLMIAEGVFPEVLSYSYFGWLCVVYLAVGSSVVGYLIQQDAIKKIGVNKTVLFNNLVTPFAMFFAFILLDETITIINLFSAGIIILAVFSNSRLK